ncbi:MAG: SIMPL domain-containing protein [Burkholderiales bacterium]|nr:SIMPL domain-containing protein [Burkholderiales bacterium]
MTLSSPRRPRPLALTAAALALVASTASAHAEPPVQGLLNLSASATAEVPQDWMTLTLSVTRQGTDARVVQTQLKQAVDAALAEARKEARPGQVELQTAGFSIEPRYGQKGQLMGWDGSTQLMIQGRDMPAIAQLSGRISTMTIAGVEYSISREARQKAADELSSQAVARFRARAGDLAKDFGYAGYTVREVNVQTQEHGEPRPRFYAAAAPMAEAAKALPVEAGKGTVSVTVSGSVQMK